ncbi:hypothetical protein VCR3J2_60017 [Vibrio coralliirubri]|nr:hypothetical protein VCR8J2_570016 [Vibrio coralliirubri]CDU01733.1 hypothetical protein VCR3J2_60017 [Vibrio coralliirubri]
MPFILAILTFGMTAIDMTKQLMRIVLVSKTCLEETKSTAFRLRLVWQVMTVQKRAQAK